MTSTTAVRPRSGATTARVVFVAYLLFLGFTVWLPAEVSTKVTGLVGVIARWVSNAGIAPYYPSAVVLEILANVALFVPVGLLLPLALPRLKLWQIVLIGGLMSGLIESVQSLMPSRVPALSDLIANTLGTFIGAATTVVILRIVADRRSRAA
jgi:glycopeptide antibiotics resistance protein